MSAEEFVFHANNFNSAPPGLDQLRDPAEALNLLWTLGHAASVALDAHYASAGEVEVASKGDEGPVTPLDLAINEGAWEYLDQHYMGNLGLLGEEGTKGAEQEIVVVMDSVDSTFAAAQRRPDASFIAGVMVGGKTVAALRYPPGGEAFGASWLTAYEGEGGGAFSNGKPIPKQNQGVNLNGVPCVLLDPKNETPYLDKALAVDEMLVGYDSSTGGKFASAILGGFSGRGVDAIFRPVGADPHDVGPMSFIAQQASLTVRNLQGGDRIVERTDGITGDIRMVDGYVVAASDELAERILEVYEAYRKNAQYLEEIARLGNLVVENTTLLAKGT